MAFITRPFLLFEKNRSRDNSLRSEDEDAGLTIERKAWISSFRSGSCSPRSINNRWCSQAVSIDELSKWILLEPIRWISAGKTKHRSRLRSLRIERLATSNQRRFSEKFPRNLVEFDEFLRVLRWEPVGELPVERDLIGRESEQWTILVHRSMIYLLWRNGEKGKKRKQNTLTHRQAGRMILRGCLSCLFFSSFAS